MVSIVENGGADTVPSFTHVLRVKQYRGFKCTHSLHSGVLH